MAIDATDATKDPRGATAPRPQTLKTGLYSVRDFVRPGEEKQYADTLIDLMAELSPKGALEECFATEIMKSTWRLRRCRNSEQDLAASSETDPMVDEKTENRQKTVDRSRAQSHYLLRRSISELSKLQTARTIRMQLDAESEIPGLADLKQVLKALKMNGVTEPQANEKATQQTEPDPAPAAGLPNMDALMALADHQLAQRYRESGMSSFCKPIIPPTPATSTPVPTPDSFCKTARPAAPTHNRGEAVSTKVPRNAACPCGSGVKFKRCCGNPAAPPANSAPGKAA